MDCSHAQIASTIKMAILNHANNLPLNLHMGNLLLGTTINFLIVIVKMFYISQYVIIVTTFTLEKLLILNKEYLSTNQMKKIPKKQYLKRMYQTLKRLRKN